MNGLSRTDAALKRAFDLAVSAIGLLLFGWLILLAAGASRIDTGQSGFFTQERVGRHGRLFRVIKLRTMRPTDTPGTTVTVSDDPRITRLGRLLRRLKLDELPQLINVLTGQMSIVGPRPDVPGFADRLTGQERDLLLSVRPGITGPATLKYRDEERQLAKQEDPEKYNREIIYPDKVRLNIEYVRSWSMCSDLMLIWQTLFPKHEARHAD